MTDPDSELASFRFDEAKSFSDNCRAFLASLEKVDADMAVILKANWNAVCDRGQSTISELIIPLRN